RLWKPTHIINNNNNNSFIYNKENSLPIQDIKQLKCKQSIKQKKSSSLPIKPIVHKNINFVSIINKDKINKNINEINTMNIDNNNNNILPDSIPVVFSPNHNKDIHNNDNDDDDDDDDDVNIISVSKNVNQSIQKPLIHSSHDKNI